MPIGISDEHLALHDAVRRWSERHCPPSVPRSLLDAETEPLPSFWSELAGQGWLGLHVPEEHGGSGYGVPELVVVLEELGRVVAPGPTLPTVLTAALVARGGNEALAKRVLPALATGASVGVVALDSVPTLTGTERAGGLHVQGRVRPVLSGHLADLLLAPVDVDGRPVW